MNQLGCQIYASNVELARTFDIIVIAVKPDMVAPVLQEIAECAGMCEGMWIVEYPSGD